MKPLIRCLFIVIVLVVTAGCSSLHDAMYPPQSPPPPPTQITPATTYPSPSKVTASHRSPNPAVRPKCYPTRVTISSLDIDESIIPYGLSKETINGKVTEVLEPPATQTIWYDKSVLPGQKGISLIAGHVTYYGPSVFYKLGTIKKGARIQLRCNDGAKLALAVTRTASINKQAATTDQRIWGMSSSPVVVFVTCDIKSPMINGHHTNNFVVWTKLTN